MDRGGEVADTLGVQGLPIYMSAVFTPPPCPRSPLFLSKRNLPHTLDRLHVRCFHPSPDHAALKKIKIPQIMLVKMPKSTNAQIHKCTNPQIHKSTNAQIHKFTNPQIHKKSTCPLFFTPHSKTFGLCLR